MNFLRQDPIQQEINDILKDLGKIINKKSSLPDHLKSIVHDIKEKLDKGGYPPSGVAAPIFPTDIQRSMARIYVLALQSDKHNYRKSAFIQVYWMARDKSAPKHADSTAAPNGLQLLEEHKESVIKSLNTILENDQLSIEDTLKCSITLAHLGYTEIRDVVVKLLADTQNISMSLASYFLDACLLLNIPAGLTLAYSVADAFQKFPSGNGIGKIPYKEAFNLLLSMLNDEVIDYLEKMIKDFYRELKGKGQGIIIGQLTRLWVPHHGFEVIFERLPQSQNKRIIQILAEFVKDAIPLEDEIVLSSRKRPDGGEERQIQYILGNNSIRGAAKRIVSTWNNDENMPALSVLGQVVPQAGLQSLMGKQFTIKKAAVTADKAETIEVPNVWGTDDGKPFVILRYPNMDEIFKSISSSDFSKTIEAYLGHPDPQVRIATLNQVIARGTGAYNQRIIDVLADKDGDVRAVAAQALWTDFSAVEFALACLRDEARGYNSFGTATASTMTPKQAVEGVEILRRAAPTQDDLDQFEAVYDELWNAEQREEKEREAYRAKKSKIEEIKKQLSSEELEELRASMSDVEREFDIGDVFLNKKIAEKYLNEQDESQVDSQAFTEDESPALIVQESVPAEHIIPEAPAKTGSSAAEILCPYCESYIVPEEIAGKFYCPNDGRLLDLPAKTGSSAEEILCPYCESYIVPEEIAGKFYCPNDGRLLDLPASKAVLENTSEHRVTVYCGDCGRTVGSGKNASVPEQCPFCESRNLISANST